MQPVELRSTFPMALQDGLYSTTTDVWKMLVATRAGNLAAVKAMVEQTPSLVRCEHNYMPPLQLAVREGHVEVVEYLLQCGAYDPKFVTYPYKETIHTLADDRNFREIGELLERFRVAERARVPGQHEAGHIDYSADPTQANREQLEKLVNADALGEIEKFAEARPGLLQDPLLFWAEGVLSVPCRGRRVEMIELLLRLGARVPEIAKWAPYYYFRHSDVAERLLEAGMNPAHMNWHRTTLLHHVAWEGDLPKATLLLKHGADVNALDDEFRSTPLGMAARAGRREIAELLLENGADPKRAGAPWAMPMAWAQKKGHATVQEVLKSANA
jgi:ankyrin repeat protein